MLFSAIFSIVFLQKLSGFCPSFLPSQKWGNFGTFVEKYVVVLPCELLIIQILTPLRSPHTHLNSMTTRSYGLHFNRHRNSLFFAACRVWIQNSISCWVAPVSRTKVRWTSNSKQKSDYGPKTLKQDELCTSWLVCRGGCAFLMIFVFVEA